MKLEPMKREDLKIFDEQELKAEGKDIEEFYLNSELVKNETSGEFSCPNCGNDLSNQIWFGHCDDFGFCTNLYKCHKCGATVANKYDVETKTNSIYITEDPREEYFKKREK